MTALTDHKSARPSSTNKSTAVFSFTVKFLKFSEASKADKAMKSVPIPFILVALVAQTLLLQQPACAGFLITVVVAECNQGMIWVPPPRAVKHMCLQCLCITPTYSVCKTVLLLPHAACTTIEITTPGTTTTTEEATTPTSTSTTTEEGESEEEGSEEEERRRRVKGGRRVRFRKV